MYFNKTHCSMTFDPFLGDLELLTPLTPAGDKRWTHILYSSCCEETKRVIYVFYTPMHARIQHFHSRAGRVVQCADPPLSQSFSFFTLFRPSTNAGERIQTAAKSTQISCYVSAHYIILSSLQAPRLPSYGQSLQWILRGSLESCRVASVNRSGVCECER